MFELGGQQQASFSPIYEIQEKPCSVPPIDAPIVVIDEPIHNNIIVA